MTEENGYWVERGANRECVSFNPPEAHTHVGAVRELEFSPFPRIFKSVKHIDITIMKKDGCKLIDGREHNKNAKNPHYEFKIKNLNTIWYEKDFNNVYYVIDLLMYIDTVGKIYDIIGQDIWCPRCNGLNVKMVSTDRGHDLGLCEDCKRYWIVNRDDGNE